MESLFNVEITVRNFYVDLNVTCNRTAEPGREIINCMFTNPLESVMCVYDGGMPETCSFPLILDVERFGTDNHTLLITAVDGFGQTKVLEFVFQLSSRKLLLFQTNMKYTLGYLSTLTEGIKYLICLPCCLDRTVFL